MGVLRLSLFFMLSLCSFAQESVEVAEASGIAEAYARTSLGLNPNRILQLTRREDLEQDLSSLQTKPTGQIRERAIIFQISDIGYVSLGEYIRINTSELEEPWIVAVIKDARTPFGLRGFKDSEDHFNQLARSVDLSILDDGTARDLASFYIETVWGDAHGLQFSTENDFRQLVEEFERRASWRDPGFSSSTWIRRLKESGVQVIWGKELAKRDGEDANYVFQVDLLNYHGGAESSDLYLMQVELVVGQDGTVSADVWELFPKL